MRWLLAPLLALSWLTATAAAARELNPEIWFNPHTPADYDNMWTSTAPWQNAANRVQVLEIVHWWLDAATDAQILAMTNFAQLHHMKIDFEIEPVIRYPTDNCGHIEGYTPPGALTTEVAKLKRLGVKVDMMAMDEPIWFAHYDTDPASCHFAIPDLVDRIATNVSGVIALYPDIQLYEIEPVPGITNFPDWRDSEMQLRAGLIKAIGKPILAIQLDVDWSSPAWITPLRNMQTFVHHQNMGLGIFYDGIGNARNDAEWMTAAQQHYDYIEGTLGIVPDQAIFASWNAYPVYNMPETSPTAQTYLINNYFRRRTLIGGHFVGRGVSGRLTTHHGKPIANETINGYVPGVDFKLPLPETVIQGVVPSNAATALFGIRLNAECGCQGVNDVLIGALQYQETQGGSSHSSFLYPPVPGIFNGSIVDGEWVGGTKVTRVITTPTQSFYPNSNAFPVTPSANYTLTFPTSTIGGEGWYGNVFLLWFDARGNAIERVIAIPDPGKRLMSTATTAADGTFHLSNLPRMGPGAAPVTVEFAGDDTYRASGWSPLK